MNRIENRVSRMEFDEDAIRKAYLAGETASSIAARCGGHNWRAVSTFISDNKQAWLDEARFSRIVSDDRRTVLPWVGTEKSGGAYIMPISLPRNTLHLLALADKANGHV
ncbi:hypothetical protein [Rhizobium sp. SG570]|uniref:hypothetical protein n=1 Tax=Rhizobium sp. SG570 TaxID=2587113 RepID=UPI0014472480|nr:hypothetical protein [Rhizobium sp. SG570]NKJ34138.1 hypothetical protein [Rhizobium sp. SG570]